MTNTNPKDETMKDIFDEIAQFNSDAQLLKAHAQAVADEQLFEAEGGHDYLVAAKAVDAIADELRRRGVWR